MEYLCREISKIKEARRVFFCCCWKEIKLFSKTMLGKGESSAARFINYVFRKVYSVLWKEKEKRFPANRVLENLREIKYLHASIT